MSARPFQVGDRVRITHHWSDGDEVHEGVGYRIGPVKGHPDVMNLTIKTDEPYTQSDGNVVQNDSVSLTLDCTAARFAFTSIELIEAAPEPDVDTTPTPVAYLVAERRDGRWLIGDEWSSEHATLEEAREHIAAGAELHGKTYAERGYDMGILAVTLLEVNR